MSRPRPSMTTPPPTDSAPRRRGAFREGQACSASQHTSWTAWSSPGRLPPSKQRLPGGRPSLPPSGRGCRPAPPSDGGPWSWPTQRRQSTRAKSLAAFLKARFYTTNLATEAEALVGPCRACARPSPSSMVLLAFKTHKFAAFTAYISSFFFLFSLRE